MQVTSLNVTAVTGGQMPIPADAKQTGTSFGDARVGATWTQHLVGDQLIGGFGLRARLATHTTNFSFHLQDGSLLTFVFPYYFHIEPTAILGGAIGRFIFVINEGLDVFWGPDGTIEGQLIVVPTIIFWDSHVAVSYSPWDFVGASVEFGTDIQVNDVNDPQFPIQNIRSAWVAPAIQFHVRRLARRPHRAHRSPRSGGRNRGFRRARIHRNQLLHLAGRSVLQLKPRWR